MKTYDAIGLKVKYGQRGPGGYETVSCITDIQEDEYCDHLNIFFDNGDRTNIFPKELDRLLCYRTINHDRWTGFPEGTVFETLTLL